MALYPNKFVGQDRLQPGARGEKFKANLPGYRDDENRINRTATRLNHNEHDTPNIKYMFDDRLPTLFKYGFAYGYNQIVIPKGRIVAVDPYRDMVDFDMQKEHNTLTLANGGAPVRLRKSSDLYKDYSEDAGKIVSTEAQGKAVGNVGIEWMPLNGMTKAYSDMCYRPFTDNTTPVSSPSTVLGPVKQLTDAGLKIHKDTGLVVKTDGSFPEDLVMPGNHPIGVLIRNEYTRDEDALNGMAPGAVNTDCLLELPWFAYKDKAESNPWGSAYGGLFPGALVKSDENGRVVVSPLSYEAEVATMSIAEYELERQQVIGQVYSASTELIPEGSYKWATWALSDRLNFEEFNPDEWRQNNRRGEDSIKNSPYQSTGKYPGYPYDKNYGANDLHMLASTRGNYDQRLQQEYQYENLGIPGLTDGKNVAKTTYEGIKVGELLLTKDTPTEELLDIYFRIPEVDVLNMKVKLGTGTEVSIVEGMKVEINGVADAAEIRYANNLQGLFTLKVISKEKLNAVLTAASDVNKLAVDVVVAFDKKGMAGVPTFMDWDGCIGSVKVLLQK